MKQRCQHLARVLGRDHHPLCRPVDRAESTALTALVATLLIAWLVVALLVGQAADAAGVRQQHAERGWREVQATLRQSAAEQPGSGTEWGAAWVPASWHSPGGQRRTGLVATDLSARAGQHITIWVDTAGRITRPPLTRAGIDDQVGFAFLSVTMGFAILLGLAVATMRLLFDRRRMAGWQRAWDAVGPLWSRR